MRAGEYTAYGHTRTLRQWAKTAGVTPAALYWRINKMGLTPEQAIEMGEGKHGARPRYYTTYKGERISVHALSVQTGVHYQLLRYRIDRMGLTGDEAVERIGRHGGRRDGAGRKKKFANGCRYHADCDSCPFDDCRM